MLILSRQIGETICILGEYIKIKVMDVKGKQVRIGIDAPKTVSVDREEVHARKKQSYEDCARKNKKAREAVKSLLSSYNKVSGS